MGSARRVGFSRARSGNQYSLVRSRRAGSSRTLLRSLDPHRDSCAYFRMPRGPLNSSIYRAERRSACAADSGESASGGLRGWLRERILALAILLRSQQSHCSRATSHVGSGASY
jgi:hypothetical protein